MSESGGTPAPAAQSRSLLSSDQERAASLVQRLGLPPEPSAKSLALEALRHGSWLHEQRAPINALRSNERLEFLGDSVLGLLVSQRCCDRFPDFAEGDLTRARAALVKAESLAQVARNIGLGELLLLGRGEERSGGREKQNLLADALEASVAAVFLSSGLEAAGAAVDHLFGALLDHVKVGALGRDYKTELQELLQGIHRIAPGYQVIDAPGPQHARTFEVQVQFLSTVLGRGSGRTKKDAEQSAAKAALEHPAETRALAKQAAERASLAGQGAAPAASLALAPNHGSPASSAVSAGESAGEIPAGVEAPSRSAEGTGAPAPDFAAD